jgi:PAS domain S-box-containing protein
MRQFIKRALQKIDTLNTGQFRDLLILSAKEIDRLETVMDSLIRGVLVCDITHNLILANKAARRFLSIVSYEQGRESIWSVIPEERISEFLAQTLLSTDKVEEKEFNVEINGMEKLLSVSVMPVVQDRQVTGSLILVDDITERRSREAKMRRMENLASLTTLAAGVAHEIKNPLGSISIHVQLIQKAVAAQEKLCNDLRYSKEECNPNKYFRQIDKYLKVVDEEIDRLNAIVVDFLFAVRPINANLRRGDINTLIRELADFVSFELKDARIESVLTLAENICALDFDAGLIKPALLNVIKNAAAAMSAGGKLTITTEEAEEEIRIIIADTGIGIPEENLSKIFEPYFSTKENGTGLGLTVLFKVVKEHRGEITVKSREGEGTVFTIALPKPQIERKLITYEAKEVQ